MPVVSWLFLRGRCRHCHQSISATYPLVELACAGLFAGTAARFGYDWALPAFLVLFAGLLALSVIDVERLILPRAIVWPLSLAVGVLLFMAAAAMGEWHDLLIGAVSAAAWFIVFYAMFAISPRYLGFGDVRLAPVLGLSLGWLGWRYVLLGFFRGQPDRRSDRDRADRHPPNVPKPADPLRRLPRPWGAPWRCSPDPNSCGPSRRLEPVRFAQRTISIRRPWSSHSGSCGMRTAARAKIRRAVQTNTATSSRWAMDAPGSSVERIRSTAGNLA